MWIGIVSAVLADSSALLKITQTLSNETSTHILNAAGLLSPSTIQLSASSVASVGLTSSERVQSTALNTIVTPYNPYCTSGPECNVFQRISSTSPVKGHQTGTSGVASTSESSVVVAESVEVELVPQLSKNVSYTNATNSTIGEVDECRFMSFEEWKRQKQEEAAAESESASSAASGAADLKSSSTQVSSPQVNTSSASISTIAQPVDVAADEEQGHVYKKRFNYASSDCAATIVKANSQAKGALAILHENKDSYLLNQCSLSNKFVVIEMCQDILVNEVVIGNFEFFSSMFKDIKVSVSDRFPATKWEVLGEFTAENVRDLQVFAVKNPLIWARYLKLEILSHYGDEFYCPLSVVRVHGKTMMEEFKEEQKQVDQVSDTAVNGSIFAPKVNLSTASPNSTLRDDECRVVLPHLLLHEFLQEINGTDQYCAAVNNDREVKTIETTATTQESIYKNIMKRLSLLESNATLSLLYIEEQSKLLSTAFTNLERRQTSTFNELVELFNSTMLSQVSLMKGAFASIQNEASQVLQNQENRYRGGLSDANFKLSMLANELRFHKRITLFNTLIIVCLCVYVMLTRDTAIDDYVAETKNHLYQYPVSKKSAFKRKTKKRTR